MPIRSPQLDVDAPLDQVLILVLALVILKRERLALVEVQDLAGVAVCDRPAELVTPRFIDLAVLDPAELRSPPHLWRGGLVLPTCGEVAPKAPDGKGHRGRTLPRLQHVA